MKTLDFELGDELRVKDYSRKEKTYLILRTISHSVFLLIHLSVSLYGVVALLLPLLHHEDEFVRFLSHHILAFLTLWNFCFQITFLALALVHDLLEWTGRHNSTLGKKLGYWRDVVFNGLLVPYTWFVTCMFWGLWWIDRELVFPKIFDAIVPFWFNHCVHTNIFIIFWIETILQPRRKPRDLKAETICNVTIAISYAVIYYSIYFITGRFLYNVFKVMNWWQVCLYQCLIWFSSFIFYVMHFPINRLFHGQEEKTGSEVLGDQNGRRVEEVRTGKEREGNIGKVEPVSETDGLNESDPSFTKSWSRQYRNSRGQDDTTL